METLHALQEETAGIDVHRMLHVVTVLIEQDDDTVRKEQRQFGGFTRENGRWRPGSRRSGFNSW